MRLLFHARSFGAKRALCDGGVHRTDCLLRWRLQPHLRELARRAGAPGQAGRAVPLRPPVQERQQSRAAPAARRVLCRCPGGRGGGASGGAYSHRHGHAGGWSLQLVARSWSLQLVARRWPLQLVAEALMLTVPSALAAT